eukprot:2043818-Rhodomonas_salina.2
MKGKGHHEVVAGCRSTHPSLARRAKLRAEDAPSAKAQASASERKLRARAPRAPNMRNRQVRTSKSMLRTPESTRCQSRGACHAQKEKGAKKLTERGEWQGGEGALRRGRQDTRGARVCAQP